MDIPHSTIKQLLVTGMWDQAIDILSKVNQGAQAVVYSISSLGELAEYGKLCNAIPEESAIKSPEFILGRIACNLILGNIDKAGSDLSYIDSLGISLNNRIRLCMLKAQHALMSTDLSQAMRHIDDALCMGGQEGEVLLFKGALLTQCGKLQAAEAYLQKSFTAGCMSDNLQLIIPAGELLTDVLRIGGNLSGTYSLCRRMLGVIPVAIDDDKTALRSKGLIAARTAVICYEWNLLDEASRYLDLSRQLALKTGHFDALCLTSTYDTKMAIARGDVDNLERGISTLTDWSSKPMDSRHLSYMRLCIAEMQLSRGRTGIASGLIGAREVLKEDLVDPNRYRLTLLARCGIARRAYEQAFCFLQEIICFARENQCKWLLLDSLLLSATVHVATDAEFDALRCVEEALSLGSEHRYIRSFIDKGPVIRSLIEKAFPSSSDTYVDELRLAFVQMDAYTITTREREVLRLVAEGCKNMEVALILNISEGTVRKHVESIFRKLGVTSRTQAMKSAIMLGLI